MILKMIEITAEDFNLPENEFSFPLCIKINDVLVGEIVKWNISNECVINAVYEISYPINYINVTFSIEAEDEKKS